MIQAILITLLLIIVSGIFTLFDSALSLCRKTRLEKEQGKKYKAVLKAFEKSRAYSLACRLWINILRVFAAVNFFLIMAYLLRNAWPV